MTTILLTTDLSTTSTQPFDPVSKLADQLGANIILFHVVPDPAVMMAAAPDVSPPPTVDPLKIKDEAASNLQELRHKFSDDLQVDIHIEIASDVAGCIADYAKETGPDYIAMTTHGRSGLSRVFLGSVAEAVLRRTVTPMLLYPAAGGTSAD